MSTVRVTLTLDERLFKQAREVSQGNFSRFVGNLLEEHLETKRRQRLRDELAAGYLAEADTDLEIVHDYRHVDHETALRIKP